MTRRVRWRAISDPMREALQPLRRLESFDSRGVLRLAGTGQGTTDRRGITRPARSEAKEGWGHRPGVPTNGRLYPCPARGAGPLRKSGKADGNNVVARACGRAMSLGAGVERGLGRKPKPGDFSEVRSRTSLPTCLHLREGSSPYGRDRPCCRLARSRFSGIEPDPWCEARRGSPDLYSKRKGGPCGPPLLNSASIRS